MAEFFTQIRKNNEYKPTTQEIKHVDEVLKLISVFGKTDRFDELIESGETKGVHNMCEAIEKIVRSGEARGFIESVECLRVNLGLSLEEALRGVGKTMEEYEEAKKLIK